MSDALTQSGYPDHCDDGRRTPGHDRTEPTRLTTVPGTEATAERLAPVLARFPNREPSSAYLAIRRVLDVVTVVALAPIALVLIAVAAIALKIEDRSASVLYRQLRTGSGCRRFEVFKLRSMVPDADQLKAGLADLNLRDGPDFKIEHDPRITAVGRFLRRSSIDEIPQLLNIARGDMSFIGPRPTSLGVEMYEPWQLERFEVPVGLTGLWQVAARDSESWDERIALDITYRRRLCLALDWWILRRTIAVVLRGTGSR